MQYFKYCIETTSVSDWSKRRIYGLDCGRSEPDSADDNAAKVDSRRKRLLKRMQAQYNAKLFNCSAGNNNVTDNR